MNSRERRLDTRVNIRVPLRFRPLGNPGSPEQTAESVNISQRGILFVTSASLKVGTPLEVSLCIPSGLTGQTPGEVKCVARVIHVEPNAFFGGKAGVGLHIERYEARAAVGTQKERWAS